MTTRRRTVARGAILMAAASATAAVLVAVLSNAIPSSTVAGSPPDPAPCVAIVFPDAYYQAIAELEACTGRSVAVDTAPIGTYRAIRGDVPPPGADGIRVSR